MITSCRSPRIVGADHGRLVLRRSRSRNFVAGKIGERPGGEAVETVGGQVDQSRASAWITLMSACSGADRLDHRVGCIGVDRCCELSPADCKHRWMHGVRSQPHAERPRPARRGAAVRLREPWRRPRQLRAAADARRRRAIRIDRRSLSVDLPALCRRADRDHAARPSSTARAGGSRTARSSWSTARSRRSAAPTRRSPRARRGSTARGRWVTPGVIDVHSHLGDYPSPGVEAHSDGNEVTSPVRPEVWAEHSVWPQDPGLLAARSPMAASPRCRSCPARPICSAAAA